MRIAILVLAFAACTSAPTAAPLPESVRDHLASPTRLFVAADSSGGVLTARRWSSDGWLAAEVPLVVDHGELGAHVDHDGRLLVTELAVGLGPIAIPHSVVGMAVATIDHLRIALTSLPGPQLAEWHGDDDATLATAFEITLSWAITIDGTTTELAPVRLPPIAAGIILGGNGERVDATITLGAPGTLWSWAGLIELGDLHLVLDTSTP